MAKKHPDTERVGGPGASHENRKEPQKSKPHGELSRPHPEQGNTNRTAAETAGSIRKQRSCAIGPSPRPVAIALGKV